MLIYLAMLFMVFEILSMLFNQYFINVSLIGQIFPINISVIFFCLGFFVLDMVTELYHRAEADKLIYGKIVCQVIFVVLGQIGIEGSGLQHTQLADIIMTTPLMILYSLIASLVGYKVTITLMRKLKIMYHGKFLMMRYLLSTIPGEIMFSLVFSALSFSHGRTVTEFFMLFSSLTVMKFFLSLAFSILITPITNILKLYGGYRNNLTEFIPFT